MGRYDYLKKQKRKRKSKLKIFREVATLVVITLVIAGFVLQFVLYLKR